MRRFGLHMSIANPGNGGESVSQLPLKDEAFLTFLGQNHPLSYGRNRGFASNFFHGIHRDSSKFWRPLQLPSAVDSRVGRRLPSEGEGHTFESCRVRPSRRVSMAITVWISTPRSGKHPEAPRHARAPASPGIDHLADAGVGLAFSGEFAF